MPDVPEVPLPPDVPDVPSPPDAPAKFTIQDENVPLPAVVDGALNTNSPVFVSYDTTIEIW